MRTLLLLLPALGLAACAEPPPENQMPTEDTANAMFPTEAPPVGVTDGPPLGLRAGEAQAGGVTPAIPAAFHGTYDESATACAQARSVYRLVISDDALRFHESVGIVQAVREQGPREIAVTARYTGEGETWDGSRTLTLSDDSARLTVTQDDSGMERVRCP